MTKGRKANQHSSAHNGPEHGRKGHRRLKTLADLTQRNIETIARLEESTQAKRSRADLIADMITRFAGSIRFAYVHLAWFIVWVLFNALPIIPRAWHFDPYPFTFLTFVVSLEAIFLSTFILISQNHEQRIAERRNHLDLQINLLSEQENSKMLVMLEAIQEHLGMSGDDPDVKALEEATRPDQLVQQIEEAAKSHERK